MSESLRPEMELAAEIAWTAGRATLRHFQTGVVAESKADTSPVTVAVPLESGALPIKELLVDTQPPSVMLSVPTP